MSWPTPDPNLDAGLMDRRAAKRSGAFARLRAARALLASVVLTTLALAPAQEDAQTLQLTDFTQGVPSADDDFGNGIGFVTWQDGGGSLDLSAVTVEPGDAMALPDQEGPESVLRVDHTIASWGGITHAFSDEAMTRWIARDLSPYLGLRFWYAGAASGGQVQVDLFDNRNPNLTGDSAERWFYRFTDDSSDWRLIEIPFSSFARRTDFQPGGAPDDGLGLDQASGWALGFPPGSGSSHVARVEAYGTSGTVSEGSITIEFATPAVRVVEGDDVVIRVLLSEAGQEAVSVRVFVRGEDAEAFRDFVPVNELLVFPPGVSEASFSLRTLQDSRHTGDQRAIAILDGPRGAELGFGRRAVILIQDDDPFDPDLIADFGQGLDGFTAMQGTTIGIAELVDSAATARPGQDRFERMLALAWEEEAAVQRRFAQAVDASHADGVEFWYRGDGSGRTVRVTVLGARDEDRAWQLVWSDEFEGLAGAQPDFGVWTPEIGDGSANGIAGWGNAERQSYTDDPANLFLDGEGNLVIRVLETRGEAPPCYYGGPCEYTSARIITAGTVEVTYGRIEARIKLPRGQGIWPAFWMLGHDIGQVGWPESGEIDIMEHIGREPNQVHGTIHGPGYSGAEGIGRGTTLPGGDPVADDFHVFAVDWTPESITWSLDGVAFSTLSPGDLPSGARWVYDHPFFIILNVAVGGYWPGYPDASTVFPQEMLIDYVRVYASPDTSERFTSSFVDDAEGWVRVRLPFEGFSRAEVQPPGAPDSGMLDSGKLWGLDLEVRGGPGSAAIDEVRWYLDR